ncbi:response regulator [Flavobacteriaceae bacterium]|nr:response regulator [Flavobacteriaceae bacterium]
MENLNILIIEDNKIVVMGIKKIYNKHQPEASLSSVENGLEAIEFLSKIEDPQMFPCFIILDINMPIMDGIEFLEIIKQDQRLQQIPVVIHTTSSNIEDYKKCKAIGVCGYYVKDVDFSVYKNNLINIANYWKNSYRKKL